MFFFSERKLKKALCDRLTRAALSGLLSTMARKLANQVARFLAIAVKYLFIIYLFITIPAMIQKCKLETSKNARESL